MTALCAQHWLTGEVATLHVPEPVAARTCSAPADPPSELWLAPPLFDIQVNGYAGVDFQQGDLTGESFLRAVRGLRAAGCTRFFCTLITDEWSRLLHRLEHLRRLCAEAPELAAAVAGWHMEGPFLSAEPGFCGAHDPAWMVDPSAAAIRELRAVAGEDRVLLTLAPERPGALEAIKLAVALGMRVSLGHTNASAERIREARSAGASGFTHLGNGCPQALDRHDNILWRMLDIEGFTVGVIPDGLHVSPALFRLVHRVLPRESLLYTTDAMAGAGAGPGRFTVGPLEVDVGLDGVSRQPGRTNFAGSALTPTEGVVRAAAMLRVPWQEAWRRFSVVPAQFVSGCGVLGHSPFPACPADGCLVRATGEGRLLEVCGIVPSPRFVR